MAKKHVNPDEFVKHVVGYYSILLYYRVLAIPMPWTLDEFYELLVGPKMVEDIRDMMGRCDHKHKVSSAYPFESFGSNAIMDVTRLASERVSRDLDDAAGGFAPMLMISASHSIPAPIISTTLQVEHHRDYGKFLRWSKAHMKVHRQNLLAAELIRRVVREADTFGKLKHAWPTLADDLAGRVRDPAYASLEFKCLGASQISTSIANTRDATKCSLSPGTRQALGVRGGAVGALLEQATALSRISADENARRGSEGRPLWRTSMVLKGVVRPNAPEFAKVYTTFA